MSVRRRTAAVSWLAGIAPEVDEAELRQRVARARRAVAAAEARLLANPGASSSLREYNEASRGWKRAKAVLGEWLT